MRRSDVEALRALPGVRAAETISAIPLSGSGSSTGYKPLGSEMNTAPTGFFSCGVGIVETLGVRLLQGRDFRPEDITESKSKNVLVTKAFADRLFPEGDALGQRIQGHEPENPHTIVGIIDQMHGSWPMWENVAHVLLQPGKPGNFNWGTRYLVRAEPGQVGELLRAVEERLLALNEGRNIRVETLAEIKAETFQATRAVITMLSAVILLLRVVTSLGIIGITSFSVTGRTHQIGTRRALGTKRVDILRYFLLENWLITSLGVALGVALTYGLNYLLVRFVSGAKMDWKLVVAGILLVWVLGQLSALLPAVRGTRVSPAVATRTL